MTEFDPQFAESLPDESIAQLSKMTGKTEEEIQAALKRWDEEGLAELIEETGLSSAFHSNRLYDEVQALKDLTSQLRHRLPHTDKEKVTLTYLDSAVTHMEKAFELSAETASMLLGMPGEE